MAVVLLAILSLWTHAADQPSQPLTSTTPPSAPGAPPGAAPAATSTPFAYAAPAFIKELDGKYPVPPPAPPWPPRLGGVLHMPIPVQRAFDPTVSFIGELALVYDTLLEWEGTWYVPDIQKTPIIRKNLAESWEMVDPSTWDFQLRQGVKFHNVPPVNGREMTAEDVQYSYELLKHKPGFSNREVLVKAVEVLDTHKVRFRLEAPDPNFALNITNGFSPVIVPKEAVEAPGGLGKHPIGTGAFMLREFVTGEGILLVKNPDYHMRDKDGRQLPYLDAVRLVFTRDAATEVALFRTKQLDIMRGPPTLDMLFELLKTVPDAWLYRIPSFGWGAYDLFLKLDKAPYNDVRVRRAISMAINRDAVAEVINRGDAALYGPFPWGLAGFTERAQYSYENLGPNYQYNPKRAKELLAEAGYPKGFAMTIEWGELQGFVVADFVTLVARFLEEIGLQVKLKQLEFSTWWAMRFGTQPYTDVLGVLTPAGSGPAFLDWGYLPYHSKAPSTINVPRINDTTLDALLDAWRVAPTAQQPLLQKQVWDHLREQVYRISTIVAPHYRVSQAYVYAGGNPYCWFPGFCSYEAKNTWMTEKAPGRTFATFAH
jgi:peptide/nickel transport system substrate-binding protein